MFDSYTRKSIVVLLAICLLPGCMLKPDLSTLERPARPSELAAYDVFVGDWTWEAEVTNAEGPGKNWEGTASWQWTLDQRSLEGTLGGTSDVGSYNAQGLWSWNPATGRYEWAVFNDWGYTQLGRASYNESTSSWRMPFKGTGLDGTTSYGVHRFTIVDNDHLEWEFEEWADPLHIFQKSRITARYTRKN